MNVWDALDATNLICRIDGLIGRVKKRGGRRLKIDIRCGMTGAEIERYLRRYRVAIFGRGVRDGAIYFSVGPKQARWAEYLLHRHGLPVVSAPVDAEQAARARALYEQGAPLPRLWADDKLPPEAAEKWADATHKTTTKTTKHGPDRDRTRRKGKAEDALGKVLGVFDRF